MSIVNYKIVVGGIVLILMLNACKMGPNYSRPPQISPQSFRSDFSESASIANTEWWGFFGDTVLLRLINTSLLNNRDLRTSMARMEEAGAELGIVRADLFPRINYGADGKGQVTTEGGGIDGSGAAVMNISYQVDLWGRIHRLNEAALEEYLSTEQAYRNVTLTVVAGIADAYLLLRDLDNRLLISEQTEVTWQSNLDIVTARQHAGIVSEVDVNQAIIQLTEAQASVQTFSRLRNHTENAISVLMGTPPQAIPRGLILTEQFISPDVPVGFPSELLDRRPDVMEVEQKLHAQMARIGAAEALLYPQLTITADLGASFANPVIGFSALGAQLLGPLFNSGENKKRVQVEIARTEQLLNNYEQTYLLALQEVEDAMASVRTYEREYDIRERQMQAANTALELSWVRYQNGITSYLEVLDLQRSRFSSQLKASEALQLQLTSTVILYQALGGGWQIPADTLGVQ